MSQNRQKDNKPNFSAAGICWWDLEHRVSRNLVWVRVLQHVLVNQVCLQILSQCVWEVLGSMTSPLLDSVPNLKQPKFSLYVSQGCFSFLRCARSTVCDSPPEGMGYVIHWRKNKDNPNSTTLQNLQLIPSLLTPMGKEGLAAEASYLPS